MSLGVVSNICFKGGEDKKQLKAPGEMKHVALTLIGTTAGFAALNTISTNQLYKINNLPQNKVDLLHNTYKEILKETGLASKGVTITNLPDKKIILPFYNTYSKEIVLSQKKFSASGFHEIGHAIDDNFSKLGNKLLKIRGRKAKYAPLAFIAYCILTKNKKPDKNGEISTAGKINNFIRNNAGKLAFLATTPILLEEAMASVKGEKLANKFLKDKDLIRVVKKTNLWGYSTYLAVAVLAGIGAWAATKIKDGIPPKKEAKLSTVHK